MAGVKLTITSDFVQAVRDAVDDEAYAANYTQDRGDFGVAMAKTVPQADGTIKLVVDVGVLAEGAELDGAERLFAHEARHIALHQRGESIFNAPGTDSDRTAAGQYLAMAGIACEEFRVEAALRGDGPHGHHSGFAALLTAFDASLGELSRDYQQSFDVRAISRGVGEQFHAVVTACGYLAAAMEVEGKPLPAIDPRVDRRVFGTCGAAVIDRLRTLPSADQPTSLEELAAIAREVSDLIESWLTDIGFRWEDTADGDGYFHVLKPWLWQWAQPVLTP
jgi:hypothetical protein